MAKVKELLLPTMSMNGDNYPEVRLVTYPRLLPSPSQAAAFSLLAPCLLAPLRLATQTLAQMVVINAPAMFDGAFAVVKKLLPAETQKKIKVRTGSARQNYPTLLVTGPCSAMMLPPLRLFPLAGHG